jgi:LSD1 subclass zinc finger protein
MSQTTQCPNPSCRTVLNLPPGALGKRLKCPKCGTKFQSGTPESRPPSSEPGVAEAGPASTAIRATGYRHDDDALPVASGDLRETFDIPLMMDEDEIPRRPGRNNAPDPSSLFRDDPPSRRRPTGAAARSQPRRCSCGGVVPAGMSLCSRCGLDLDTGLREEVAEDDEDLLADAPTMSRRGAETPFGILVVGGVCFLASVLLAFFCLLKLHGLGALSFALVCVFGIAASIQFLRGKSAKLLMVALMLGAAIDVVALIALPVYDAMNNVAPPAASVDQGDDEEKITPLAERVDPRVITWGIVILLVDAGFMVYLSTAGIRRHFEQHAQGIGVPPF